MTSFRHNPYDLTNVYIVHDERSVGSDSPGVEDSAYCHNPYGQSRSESPAGVDHSACFEQTLHKALIASTNFEPFPLLDSNHASVALPFTKENCCRLFMGQIPYGTPARQVEWMVFAATGRRVYFTETIQRWTGARAPKGCAHTYCLPDDRDFILQTMHRRVLVDDSGIWIAADAAQHAALEEYCQCMKADKTLRFPNRPYQPIVVEVAESSFVPRHRSPQPEASVPVLPPLYHDFVVFNMPPVYTDFAASWPHQ